MPTQVLVGGEQRGRSIIAGTRSRDSWIGTFVTVGLIFLGLWAADFQTWAILVSLILVAVALWAWTEQEYLGGQSPVMWLVTRWWLRRAKRLGRATFVPRRLMAEDQRPFVNQRGKLTTVAAEEARAKKKQDPRRRTPTKKRLTATAEVDPRSGDGAEVPPAIGAIRPMRLDFDDGTHVGFLRHTNPSGSYISTTLEMHGGSLGLVEDDEWGAPGAAWGRMLASLASTSLVRTVQQTARVVPWDHADHTTWVLEHMAADAPYDVRASYYELVEEIARQAEQHRTWLTLKMPVTARWYQRVAEYGGGPAGELRTAWEETKTVMAKARASGISLRPLGERRSAAVIRALQDPDMPVDLHHDVDWSSCWMPYDAASDPRSMIIEGSQRRWWTRTETVTRTGISPGWLPVDFLRPLLTGVNPSVVRTITTTFDLVPARTARQEARSDVVADESSIRAAKSVSDGSSEQQLTASSQRLVDLRPGRGAAGVDWSMAFTYQAPSAEALMEASRLMESAAEEAHITNTRRHYGDQAAAFVATLPLCRGINARRVRL